MPESGLEETSTETEKTKKQAYPPGCIVKPTISAIVAWAGGIYFLSKPTIGSTRRVAAAIFIAVGTLFSLPVLVILFGMLAKYYFTRRLNRTLDELTGPVKEVSERSKEVFGKPHEYRDATDLDFAGLDREWYDASAQELEGMGYRLLGDIVNKTIEEIYGVTTVIRNLVSSDGTTQGSLYQVVLGVAPGRSAPREFRTIDFESEFVDGEFLMTSNNAESAAMTSPPAIHQRRRPADMPFTQIAAYHESEKVELQKSKGGTEMVRISTMKDSREFQRRMHEIKMAFRKGKETLDPEEVRRIAELHNPDDDAGQLLAAMSARLSRERDAMKKKPVK